MSSNRIHSNRLSWTASAILATGVAVLAAATALGSTAGQQETNESMSPQILLNDSFLWAMEEEFNEDFNGDGYIGQPPPPPPPGGGGGTGR